MDKIQVDTDNLVSAEKSGDKGKIKTAQKTLKDDFNHAKQDNISKGDLDKISGNVNDELNVNRLASSLVNGKLKANDPKVAASIHNQFVRDCMASGQDPKNPQVAQAYFANYADQLQAGGVPADQAVQTAQGMANNGFVRPSNNRV